MTKEIELFNNEKVNLRYALLVLSKVFGFDEDKSLAMAKKIDRYESAVVFSGPETEASEKLELLEAYNESIGQKLKAVMQDAGTYKEPLETTTLKNHAVTLQFNTFVFSKDLIKYLAQSLKELDGQAYQDINFNHLISDLKEGKEVVLKEFEGDRAAAKAQIFLGAVSSMWELDKPESACSDEEKENNSNIALSARAPGYTLGKEKSLLSAKEMERRATGAVLADFATSIYDMFVEDAVQKHGSIENYLKQASPDELETYQKLESKMKEVEELKRPLTQSPEKSDNETSPKFFIKKTNK